MLVRRDVPCSMYCVKFSPKLRLDIELSVVKMTPSVFSGEYIKALPEYLLNSCFVLIINEGLVVLILLTERDRVSTGLDTVQSLSNECLQNWPFWASWESLYCAQIFGMIHPQNMLCSVAVAAGASQTKINIELSVTSEQTGGLSVLNKMLSL